ncbi:MAG: hypothetical protein J2P25_04630 [Nocardiopsaceae bacterium]|nr:hypothetical protein [Nocardiopsaceae bacterium]
MTEPEYRNPWRGAGPELLTAAIAVTATGLAGLAVAGWAGLVTTAVVAAGLGLVVVRGLAPRTAEHAVATARSKPSARSLSGYAQRRFVVAMGVRDLAFYESDLRPALEHLLAARLAERHGVNLYTDPAAARKAFCRTPRDEALWRWIDPARERSPGRPSGSTAAEAAGIPRRVLTRLVDRLEHL